MIVRTGSTRTEGMPDRVIGIAALIVAATLWILFGLLASRMSSTASQTMAATICCPCLLGITWIGMDLASGMRLGRIVATLMGRS